MVSVNQVSCRIVESPPWNHTYHLSKQSNQSTLSASMLEFTGAAGLSGAPSSTTSTCSCGSCTGQSGGIKWHLRVANILSDVISENTWHPKCTRENKSKIRMLNMLKCWRMLKESRNSKPSGNHNIHGACVRLIHRLFIRKVLLKCLQATKLAGHVWHDHHPWELLTCELSGMHRKVGEMIHTI